MYRNINVQLNYSYKTFQLFYILYDILYNIICGELDAFETGDTNTHYIILLLFLFNVKRHVLYDL